MAEALYFRLRLYDLNSDCRYFDRFRRYSRSKSNVDRNRTKFWTFLFSKF